MTAKLRLGQASQCQGRNGTRWLVKLWYGVYIAVLQQPLPVILTNHSHVLEIPTLTSSAYIGFMAYNADQSVEFNPLFLFMLRPHNCLLYWAHSMGPQRSPLSRIVVVVIVVVGVVDIDAQATRDSTTGDTWWMGVRRLAVVNGPNIFQVLLVFFSGLMLMVEYWRVRVARYKLL